MHRATILLGWGKLGREVLRRMLVTAALRDALAWETGGGDPLDRKRRLAGLELFCLTEPPAEGDGRQSFTGLFGETDLELLADVEAQIRDLDAGAEGGEAVARAVVEGAKRLLAANGEADASRPPGLDLLVVAHPHDREALGRLETVMDRVFAALGRLGVLQRSVPGAEPLAAVALLDLDGEWDPAPAARALRATLAEILERWEGRRRTGEITFTRVYLSGEMGRHQVRRSELRIDELSLFLELMLFEGRQHESLRRLFQPQPVQEPGLGTFGVRLFEHNHSLLKQLAAARFGGLWLRYLAGAVPADDDRPSSPLAERLAPFHPARLNQLLGWDEVERNLGRELGALEDELLAIPPERDDWAQAVRARYEQHAAAITAELGESAGQSAARLTVELKRFPEVLAAGITSALCDPHRPIPLGAVLAELAPLHEATRRLPAAVRHGERATESFWQRLGRLAASYRSLAGERFASKWVWALLTLLASVGWLAFARQALEGLPAPGPLTHPAVSTLLSGLQGLAHPTIASLLLLALAAAFFFGLAAPALDRRLMRLARFFVDRRQGRLVDALRAALARSGELAAPLEATVSSLQRDLAVSAASAVGREVDRAVRRIEELRREALWLSEQLGQFLALFGLTLDSDTPALELVRKDGTGIRQRTERASELTALLRAHPPEPALYRSVQGEQWVFQGWNEPGGSIFLDPLEFIARLSQRFQAPSGSLGEPRDGDAEHQELLSFLAQRGSANLAFDWRQQDGVAAPQRLAVLPQRWRMLGGVTAQLTDVSIDGSRTLSSAEDDRAYLINLQLGLPSRLLGEQP